MSTCVRSSCDPTSTSTSFRTTPIELFLCSIQVFAVFHRVAQRSTRFTDVEKEKIDAADKYILCLVFCRVKNWALKFGVDLWEFGKQVTKMSEIQRVMELFAAFVN